MRKLKIFAVLAVIAIAEQAVRPTEVNAQNNDNIVVTSNNSEMITLDIMALENELFENVLELTKSVANNTKKIQKSGSKEIKRIMRLKKKYPDTKLLCDGLPVAMLSLAEVNLLSDLLFIDFALSNLNKEHKMKIQKLTKEIDDRMKLNKTILSTLLSFYEQSVWDR